MEKVTRLIEEIEKILDNPNEGNLESFHDFLHNENIGKFDLGAWALAKPCQIFPLAQLVVESTTGIKVFRKLATLPVFVKAVLEAKSSWLEDVLDQTATSAYTKLFPDDLNCCSAILRCYSSSHEAELALRSRYFQEAVASVVRCPNEATFRHLSEIFNAIPSNILDFLNEKLLSELSSRCKELYRNATEENNVEAMLAQDVLAQLTTAFLAPHTPSKGSLETPPGQRYSETCRKRIFKLSGDSNASSVLKLTTLRLAFFSSENRGFSPFVMLEVVELAQRVIAPLGTHVRHQWTAEHPALVEKFFRRINREGLDLNVRLEAARFCISIVGPEHELLPSLKSKASEVLVALCDFEYSSSSAMATENDNAIAEILVFLCPTDSTESTLASECTYLTRMLSFVVDQCQPWRSSCVNTVFKLHQATIILRALHIALNKSGILPYIINFIQIDSVPVWCDTDIILRSFPETGEIGNCRGEEVCSKSLDQLHSEIAISFSSLLLTAAWHSNRSLQNSETCRRLLNGLKGSALKEANLVCSYSGHQTMGLEDIGARTEAQKQCDELRERLENETAQRISLEAQFAKSQKLLEEERDASNTLQQYLEDSEREAFQKSEALKSAREDYQELLQDADRKVKAVEANHIHNDLMLRAEYLGREAKVEAELKEAHDSIQQKDEELQRERDKRAKLAAEMEAVTAQSKGEVEELRLSLLEKTRALEKADSLRGKLLALLEQNQV